MSRIVHISDLHFPLTTRQLCDALLRAVSQAKPDLLVISGDLTQRAREYQFAQAQQFVEQLPRPLLIIPGNHDVPLYDVIRRFTNPLKNFRSYICDDLLPVHAQADLYVVGANSTRAFTFDPHGFWKNGSLSNQQLDQIRQKFEQAPADVLRVLVMHHPLVNPWNQGTRDTARRRRQILQVLEDGRVDVVLSGHLHLAYSSHAPLITPHNRKILTIQAGTACSTRLREEPNAFNVIDWNGQQLTLTVHRYRNNDFAPDLTTNFPLRP